MSYPPNIVDDYDPDADYAEAEENPDALECAQLEWEHEKGGPPV